MRVTVLAAIALLAASASIALAQQKPKIEQGPIARIPITDAREMFVSYCSPCHGKEGRGDGPAAAALKRAPADLTKISARNGGTFPDTRVKRYIEGADEVEAHGTRDMPMWGPLFRALSSGDRSAAALRVQALADYLRRLQQ